MLCPCPNLFCAILDLFAIDYQDMNLRQSEKLTARLISIVGTLMVGISGLAPVVIFPYLPNDHSKLSMKIL